MVRKMSRVVFPYAVVFAVMVSFIAGFGMMAGMYGWQILLWCIGACLVIGGIIFTFFEVRRLAGISRSTQELASEEAEADRMTHRIVVVEGPTGHPYPHHEDFVESAGCDQGQMTSRSPEATPVIGTFLSKRGGQERSPG
jgi:uncharacterized membrane protein